MWPWWVRIPIDDLTDVTQAIEDTEEDEEDEANEEDEENEEDDTNYLHIDQSYLISVDKLYLAIKVIKW